MRVHGPHSERAPARVACAWLAHAALSALLAATAPAVARAEEPTTVIVRAALQGTALPDDDVIGALVVSSQEARRELLAALASVADDRSPGADAEARRRALARLRDQARGAPRRFAHGLEELDGKHPNADHLIAAGLDIAAALGGPEDLEAVLTLAGPWPRRGPATGQARIPARPEALAEVLAALLRRHPDTASVVRQRYRGVPEDLAGALLEALAASGAAEGARALVGLLGVRPELDEKVLNRLQGAVRRTPVVLHGTELAVLRRYLGRPEAFLRAQAAYGLGGLGDVASVEALIALLEDGDRSVVEAAHWSLRQLTAVTMGPDPRRWRNWYDDQARTWSTRSSELVAGLGSSDRAEVLHALLDVGLLRLYRTELTPPLVELARSHPDVDVLVHTAAAVEGLRALEALPALADLLEHSDHAVRARAHRTLVVLTGEDLPPNAAVWRRRL